MPQGKEGKVSEEAAATAAEEAVPIEGKKSKEADAGEEEAQDNGSGESAHKHRCFRDRRTVSGKERWTTL